MGYTQLLLLCFLLFICITTEAGDAARLVIITSSVPAYTSYLASLFEQSGSQLIESEKDLEDLELVQTQTYLFTGVHFDESSPGDAVTKLGVVALFLLRFEYVTVIDIEGHLLDMIQINLREQCKPTLSAEHIINSIFAHAKYVDTLTSTKIGELTARIRVESLYSYENIEKLLSGKIHNSSLTEDIFDEAYDKHSHYLTQLYDKVNCNSQPFSYTKLIEHILKLPALPSLSVLEPYGTNDMTVAVILPMSFSPDTTLYMFCLGVQWLADILVIGDSSFSEHVETVLNSVQTNFPHMQIVRVKQNVLHGSRSREAESALFAHAKDFGATHMIRMNINERISNSFKENNLLKNILLGMKEGQILKLKHAFVYGSFSKYRTATSLVDFAFMPYKTTPEMENEHNNNENNNNDDDYDDNSSSDGSSSYSQTRRASVGSEIDAEFYIEQHQRIPTYPDVVDCVGGLQYALISFRYESVEQQELRTVYAKMFLFLNEGVEIDEHDMQTITPGTLHPVPLLQWYDVDIKYIIQAYHNAEVSERQTQIKFWIQAFGIEHFDDLKIAFPREYFPGLNDYTGWTGIKKPLQSHAICEEGTYPSYEDDTKHITIMHVIQPVMNDALYKNFMFEQDITWKSILAAMDYISNDTTVHIRGVAVTFADEDVNVRDYERRRNHRYNTMIFSKYKLHKSTYDMLENESEESLNKLRLYSCNLTRFSSQEQRDSCVLPKPETCPSCKKLPVLKEVLGNAWQSAPRADYVVYTNADIALQPTFYRYIVDNIIRPGNKCGVSITRREVEIEKTYRTQGNVSYIYNLASEFGRDINASRAHAGHDCFVFPACVMDKMFLGNVLIGGLGFGQHFLNELSRTCAALHKPVEKKNNKKPFVVNDECQTFHIRYDDEELPEHAKRRKEPQHALSLKLAYEAIKYKRAVLGEVSKNNNGPIAKNNNKK